MASGSFPPSRSATIPRRWWVLAAVAASVILLGLAATLALPASARASTSSGRPLRLGVR